MMTSKRKGCFAAFIDFKKAYDRVDQSKLWDCLEGCKLEGRMVGFLRAAYMECKCKVKVRNMVSESFSVGKGLRQGCVLEGGGEARCVQVVRKGLRWILVKLRGGTVELRLETGRWVGLRRENRVCTVESWRERERSVSKSW